MTIPKFTAERSLYRASEPYHMVADKNTQSDQQSIIAQQAGWYCRGCDCWYWNGWQWTARSWRC